MYRHYKDIYLRDPQGNVMAVYRIRKDSLFLTELPMYGEKRLGVMNENRFLMKKPTQNGICHTGDCYGKQTTRQNKHLPPRQEALRNHRLARQRESDLYR
ncbi:MAG: hypothetical protein KatS3mg087_2098 [Patescibacteria group bacterium]|nr:MAG: hypothetical protein KatS3mg087_2098 [Patescibacteria group bacterium]